MGRHFLVEYDQIQSNDCICCGICRTRIAFIEDHMTNITYWHGIFNRVFNVEVTDDVKHHKEVYGHTLADTYCVQCGMLLGWKLISVPQPLIRYCKEGRSFMKLHRLSYWNDEQDGGANEQAPNDQDEGDNEQNGDQDVGANEQVPNEQDLAANEQNADQDGDADVIDNIDLNPDL